LTAAWQPCAMLTRQPRALNIIATTSRMAAWRSTTKTLKAMPSIKSCRSFWADLRIDAGPVFFHSVSVSRAAWSCNRPVRASRCADDWFFTIPLLLSMSTIGRLAVASPLRISLPGLQPFFVQHPALAFINRPIFFRQRKAISTPWTCAAAIRNGFPEAVRMAFEALDGPNKVRYIRHGGGFGFIFSFFKAPIRKTRIRSLCSHRTICGPERSAATPSFQI